MAITARTPTVVDVGSGQSVTGSITNVQSGDLAVAVFAISSVAANFTAPSGWTQLAAPTNSNSTNDMIAAYYRFDPPSGPTGSTTDAASRHTCIVQAFGGVDTTTPVDVAAVFTNNSPATTGVTTLTGVTTVTAGAYLISAVAQGASTATWTAPSGMTDFAQHTSGTGRSLGFADELRSSAGATGTRQWTSTGTPSIIGFNVAIRPSAGGDPPPDPPPSSALTHDAASRSGATDATSFTTTGATTWTHTPVGWPRGVVVTITQPLGSGDEVSAVTYGGVALTRAISAAATTTEVGRVYIYHLGKAIPPGAQTVSVTTTAGSAKQAHCFTVTNPAGYDTAVNATNSGPNTVSTNPSVTVTHTGTLSGWAGYAAHFYGGASPVSTGLQTGETYRYGHDPGAAVGMVYTRHDGADAASSTYGYTTLASDDQQLVAAVIAPVAPDLELQLPMFMGAY